MVSLFFPLDRAGFVTAQFMLEVLWQSSILFIALGVLIWGLRGRRVAVRHALWVGFVLATPLLPLVTRGLGRMGAPRAALAVLPEYLRPPSSLGFRDEPTAQEPDPPGLPTRTVRRPKVSLQSAAGRHPYGWET